MKGQTEDDRAQIVQVGLNPALASDPPPVLYKYYAFSEWTQSIFEQNEVYFPSPETFNDPFDSRIIFVYPVSKPQREALWTRFALRRYPDLSPQAIKAFVEADRDIPPAQQMCDDLGKTVQKQFGVLCLAKEGDNILMWAHYAGHHTGFCLEFCTANPFFGRVRQVRYQTSRARPSQDLVEYVMVEKRREPWELVTKAKDWEYEQEWRIVDAADGPGAKTYPAIALKGVILGCRVSPGDRRRIIGWCTAREPRPTLYEAREKEMEFGLDVVPIPYEDTAK